MERARLLFRPQWPGEIQGYAVNQCRRWYPRLGMFYEFEDLLQEAALVYSKCVQMYPQIDSPQWFMGVYKRSLTNHLITLVAKHDHNPLRTSTSIQEFDFTEYHARSTEANWGMLTVMVEQLPDKVKNVLVQMANNELRSRREASAKLGYSPNEANLVEERLLDLLA